MGNSPKTWEDLKQEPDTWKKQNGQTSSSLGEAKTSEQLIQSALDSPPVEILQWLISFTLAYILIRKGITEGGILSGAKSLLGLTAIA